MLGDYGGRRRRMAGSLSIDRGAAETGEMAGFSRRHLLRCSWGGDVGGMMVPRQAWVSWRSWLAMCISCNATLWVLDVALILEYLSGKRSSASVADWQLISYSRY